MVRARTWAVLATALTAAAAPSAAAPAGATRAVYDCDDGRLLRVAYQGPQAWVQLGGRTLAMSQGMSASGARYTGVGWQWWTKGSDGWLAPLAAGETIASAPGVACQSLETPVTATTPAAAAQVVRRYFALIAEGRAAAAASLRTDGQAPAERPGLPIIVGQPGEPEGAAGSVYVEAPISQPGTREAGAAPARAGKVVLRRVNDVPGATPDQLRWRIERIDMPPAR